MATTFSVTPAQSKKRDPNLGDLWHAMRIAVLAAAWRLRFRRAAWDAQFTPADVATAAIADLRAIARADWARATSSSGGLRLDGVSPRVLNQRHRGALGPFFFPRSLYTLGKAYACKARSECDIVWASAPGIGQPGSASKPLWHREETLKTIHGYAT
jgi:hypothetical protein